MYALRKLTGAEFRLFLREPIVVFFVVAFPAVLVVILGSVQPFRVPSPDLGGARVIDIYVTIAITLALAMLALQYTPSALSSYREKGILQRLSTTPVAPCQAPGRPADRQPAHRRRRGGARARPRPAGVRRVAAPADRSGSCSPCSSPRPPCSASASSSPRSCQAARPATRSAPCCSSRSCSSPDCGCRASRCPHGCSAIGDFTPLGAGEQALHDARTGAWPHAGQLLVLAAYVVAFGVAAAKLFKWE